MTSIIKALNENFTLYDYNQHPLMEEKLKSGWKIDRLRNILNLITILFFILLLCSHLFEYSIYSMFICIKAAGNLDV